MCKTRNQHKNYVYTNNRSIKEEEDKSFFDKLVFKIFLSSLLLLSIVGVDKILTKSNNHFLIRNLFLENINLVEILSRFNNKS